MKKYFYLKVLKVTLALLLFVTITDICRLISKRRKDFEKKNSTFANMPAVYEAESPDELALVFAARKYGLKMCRRTTELITLVTPTQDLLNVHILKVLPFDSKR